MGSRPLPRQTTQQSQTPDLPPWIAALEQSIIPDINQAYAQDPLSRFTGNQPSTVQPLSPQQLASLQTVIDAQGNPVLSDPEQQAEAEYQRLVATPAGTSVATQQAEQALEQQYQQQTLPGLQNQLAAAGLGRSGALGDAIAQARTGIASAEVPLLQSDIANQIIGAQGLQSIGQILEQRPQDRAQAAFQAGEIERQAQQAPLEEQLQNYLRLQDLAAGIGGGAFGLAPSTIGQQGYSTQRTFGQSGKGMPMSFSASL
jgi:hypothetical protein